MTRWTIPLLALATAGCLGDGGGSTYQGTPLGTEEGQSQNETGFGTGTSDGSGGLDEDLYGLCLDVCSQETDLDYCVDVVCADLQGGGGPNTPDPPTSGVDYCADLTDEERATLEILPQGCQNCVCSTPPASVEAECANICGF